MSEWQPIETAPMDGTLVDLFISYGIAEKQPDGSLKMKLTGYRIADCKYENGDWRITGRGGERISHHEKPTHWMREPDPPEGISFA